MDTIAGAHVLLIDEVEFSSLSRGDYISSGIIDAKYVRVFETTLPLCHPEVTCEGSRSTAQICTTSQEIFLVQPLAQFCCSEDELIRTALSSLRSTSQLTAQVLEG